jgi:hypothetical protein
MELLPSAAAEGGASKLLVYFFTLCTGGSTDAKPACERTAPVTQLLPSIEAMTSQTEEEQHVLKGVVRRAKALPATSGDPLFSLSDLQLHACAHPSPPFFFCQKCRSAVRPALRPAAMNCLIWMKPTHHQFRPRPSVDCCNSMARGTTPQIRHNPSPSRAVFVLSLATVGTHTGCLHASTYSLTCVLCVEQAFTPFLSCHCKGWVPTCSGSVRGSILSSTFD